MVINRFIVSGSDISNITNAINTSPNFTASFHSTSSCGIDNLVYCNIEYENLQDDISIFKSIDSASSYCRDDGTWLVEPEWQPVIPGPFDKI
tara:strand:+ start:554 stop:829 length:276 start_codon:yes stop_codon:yes gene_type:complete